MPNFLYPDKIIPDYLQYVQEMPEFNLLYNFLCRITQNRIKDETKKSNLSNLKHYITRPGIKFVVKISLTLATSCQVRDFHPIKNVHAEHTKGS